jgi:cell division septum initiation protein DivIVA
VATPPAQLDREIVQSLGLPAAILKKWKSKIAAYKRAVARVAAGYTDADYWKMVKARDALDKMISEAAVHVPYVAGKSQYESDAIQALERERKLLVSLTWEKAQEQGRTANYLAQQIEIEKLKQEEREAKRPYEWMKR